MKEIDHMNAILVTSACTQKVGLNAHIAIAHEEKKVFQCRICDYNFCNKYWCFLPRVVWPSGLRRYLGNACVQKFTRKLSPNRNWVRLAKRVVKFAYNEKAKIMQDCINVKSSRNDKVRHLAWKGRNKKKKEAMCKKLHSELNSLKKFKKSTTHWLNTLNQNPYKDSEKYYK